MYPLYNKSAILYIYGLDCHWIRGIIVCVTINGNKLDHAQGNTQSCYRVTWRVKIISAHQLLCQNFISRQLPVMDNNGYGGRHFERPGFSKYKTTAFVVRASRSIYANSGGVKTCLFIDNKIIFDITLVRHRNDVTSVCCL